MLCCVDCICSFYYFSFRLAFSRYQYYYDKWLWIKCNLFVCKWKKWVFSELNAHFTDIFCWMCGKHDKNMIFYHFHNQSKENCLEASKLHIHSVDRLKTPKNSTDFPKKFLIRVFFGQSQLHYSCNSHFYRSLSIYLTFFPPHPGKNLSWKKNTHKTSQPSLAITLNMYMHLSCFVSA